MTASDCTLQHSRSSSYNTASECENRYSPWWEYDKKDLDEHVSKEKMVLGVGMPELPPYKSVYKCTSDIPPGKIVREVTETTHLKVQHSHTMGVASYVLTSEIAKDNELNSSANEKPISVSAKHNPENAIPIRNVEETHFLKSMKEVSKICEDDAWNAYSLVTKQAIKGCL